METKDKSKVAVSTTMRKKKIKTSTPPWVDKEDIRKIYEKKIELEEQTGVILNVDHIYPLTHEKLCGLTVPWNLQITTQEFNLSKQNVMFSFNEEQLLKGSKLIDYNSLSEWCLSRKGEIIVCENSNADWVPFSNLKEYWGGIKKSTEVVYLKVF